MNRIRFWPYGALAVLTVAVVAGIAAALWFKYERTAQASSLPGAARIERVDGQVGINQTADSTNNTRWIQATVNMPVSIGDRIYAKENSRTQIAFTGRNFATVEANSSLDVLDLSEGRTQVALREGSALFDVGSIASGQLFEVATPCGAVDFHQPGIYQIIINQDGNATATAYSGEAEVVGQQGTGKIQKGESLAVPCHGGPAAISRVDANHAGTLIDNYYRYRYPRKYDGRYRSYYTYLDDPYYYDPARQFSSYNYVSDYIPGVDDLDYYGDWQYLDNYGYSWRPRVDTGWAPYQSGYWTMDQPYGLTWVSSEPWGYAPYHYGRWTYVSDQWYWVPQTISSYPSYSPALVAFIPFSNSSVAWVALGPSDPYVTRYYDPYWQPTYVYPSNVALDRVMNIAVPGAVTVVPTQQFVNVIDPSVITPVDPAAFTRVRPVLDPLTVDPLRNVAFQTRAARGHVDVPRQVEQRIENTSVVVANTPPSSAFRRDLSRSLKVEPVSDRVKKQTLQVNDQRTEATRQTAPPTNIAAEQARERQTADLARQAARGDRNARQQMQDLRRQQFAQPSRDQFRATGEVEAVRVAQPAQPQEQRQQIRQQRQAQKEAARPQMINPPQRAAQPQIQREQRQRVEVQRGQGRVMRSAPQPQVVRPQSQPQQRESRPQYQRPAQPRVITPQQQPRPQRVERQAAPQSRPVMQPRPPAPQQMRPQQAQPKSQPQLKGPPPAKGPEQKGGGGRKKP